ncbi:MULTISPECIES: Gfo/Idh/MocA family oxidoreductase [unclassified Bradyrhizobium]|uniref:Gfo/Idh/MocA family protein n=1 Tax=unclassified Bradyrhizobium TaxID=2631580 RepID=UPI001FF70812|nr:MULTISPECIES: Gfo/Idh/MocA family oxidoreductase [unclassified Bradyrhizobium]MCK1298460.1 Gfo/Idh/MocA family oxidoreductase [Bradyrhizobium sp. 37]MCK1769503.1 Gfo/Idh/MocA family oxidoreductase [Bradyrhizobium sp. 134]
MTKLGIGSSHSSLTRRGALRLSAATLLAVNVSRAGLAHAAPVDTGTTNGDEISFPSIVRSSEASEENARGPLPASDRVGFAVVALGRLSVEQILPAFGRAKKSRLAALVSGSPDKLTVLGRQYGIRQEALLGYEDFERLREMEDVKAVYIVLPNSMHKEYVLRSAAIGKHVMCEKPMATSSEDARSMIEACSTAGVKLMIAYRCRYQPHHLEVIRRAQSGDLGPIKLIESINGQNQGDPEQWRLRKALAGGGSLPDVGIYCLNAARAVTGEEPVEVEARIHSTEGDPRFREVEESVAWTMRFPSGALANLSTSYGIHRASRLAVHLDGGNLLLDNAYPYKGQRLTLRRAIDSRETETLIEVSAKDQFALELDHMAECVLDDKQPKTPGEEGLRDMRLMEAIYRSADQRTSVRID